MQRSWVCLETGVASLVGYTHKGEVEKKVSLWCDFTPYLNFNYIYCTWPTVTSLCFFKNQAGFLKTHATDLQHSIFLCKTRGNLVSNALYRKNWGNPLCQVRQIKRSIWKQILLFTVVLCVHDVPIFFSTLTRAPYNLEMETLRVSIEN